MSALGQVILGEVTLNAKVVALRIRSNLQEGLGVIPSNNNKGITEEINYVSKINSALPQDIRVLAWAPVSLDFNARYPF